MKVEKIILHHSACADTDANNTAGIRAYHESLGWDGIGYHATCEQINGSHEILMGRDWNKNGAHTIGQNAVALGLCVVGNFSITNPPQAQLTRAAQFVAFWMNLYNIPIDKVHKHSEFNNTECPGTKFPWDSFIGLVRLYAI